jgi:deoxyhypusine synthase
MRRRDDQLRDGLSDNLVPLRSLDLSRTATVSDLVAQMEHTSFGARQVGIAARILQEMVEDPDCFVVLTLSGAMTIAKMSLVICDMIEWGMVQAIVSTGALMAHGFVESAGMLHFRYDESMHDTELYEKGYNRVYDTLELEKNLDDAQLIFSKTLEGLDENEVLSSRAIHEKLGKYLSSHREGRGILKSAYEKRVPVYVPAFTDSELGLDMGCYNRQRRKRGLPPLRYDPFLDLEHFAETICRQEKLGIFTIGGGVPRNWTQQVGPYLDIVDKRVGEGGGFKRFHYAVRICPEPVHWGGLSGCTYSEAVSWGKIVPAQEGGKTAEVHCDATVAWPLIVKAVQERMGGPR